LLEGKHDRTREPVMDDDHYERLRREYERQLDDDYRSWQRHRAGGPQQRSTDPSAPSGQPEGALASLGRAIGSVVTVPASPQGASALGTDPRHVSGVQARQVP
jgi:hypothetical protein